MENFRKELIDLVNKHSLESGSNTPDFLIGDYMITCFNNYCSIIERLGKWNNTQQPTDMSLKENVCDSTVIEKDVKELIETGECPLPLEVIPNNMGINLVAVDSVAWEKRNDGQLEWLHINFLPSADGHKAPEPQEAKEAPKPQA